VGIDRFGSDAPWERSFGYSRVVRAGDFVLVAGTTAIDEDGVVCSPGDAAGQVAVALEAVEAALTRAGARMEQVVQTRMYVTDISRADEIGRAHGERFGEIAPVTSMLQVEALIDPRMLVEIEAVAYVGEVGDPPG
jgi:enamine deaminase RidA (YjgF/YER057c/UK114 family)